MAQCSRNTLGNLRFSQAVIADHPVPAASGAAVGTAADRTPGGATLIATRPRLPWFGPRLHAHVLVVTSDYDAMRAAMYARQVGLPAHAVGARTARYYWPGAVLREFVAVVNERRWQHLVLLAVVVLPLPLAMLFA